ncbi:MULTISPECIES: PilN domain-containing protein [unclassified Pseudomonas]|uniref:PilN domain-containing protein n=1 Tax=unclassified Pseudomonas TaxID=196821 RepID=UPI00257CD98E|nr:MULTISPECIES: PilN domain-containing protein [unclassified Pseudomonas]
MLRINLLPWREQQRLAAFRRLRLMVLGGVVLALGAVLLMDQLARQRAHHQALANASRQAAVAELDAQLEQLDGIRLALESVRGQTDTLASLHAERGLLSVLLADLERALPEGVQVIELTLEHARLQIVGVAVSAAVVAQFMRDLERSSGLFDLELKGLKSVAAGDEFVLLARVAASWS